MEEGWSGKREVDRGNREFESRFYFFRFFPWAKKVFALAETQTFSFLSYDRIHFFIRFCRGLPGSIIHIL